MIVLGCAVALVALLGLLVGVGLRFTAPGTIWLVLPAMLALSSSALVPAVGSTVRPLPYGTPEPDAQRIGVRVVRMVTYIRVTVAASPALFGVVGSLMSGSLLPATIGVGGTVALHALQVYPRRRVLAAIHERLEAGGVACPLWDALGFPRS
jgi:hypothetical protein